MKLNFINKLSGGIALVLVCAVSLQAQQRGGGGGGGFGGFGGGGFGGGGFGGGANRGGGASSSSSSYNNNGQVGNAIINVDPNTHVLTVIADKQTAAQIQRVIQSLDAPEPQVLIKVVFLEVQHNNASEIGVQGTYTGNPLGSLGQLTGFLTNYAVISGAGSNATKTIAPSSITPVYQSMNVGNSFGLPLGVTGASGNGGLYQVLGNDFTATIQAVAAAGKAQVLSRPSILARDGQMAQITVGQEIYMPSGVTYSSTTTGGTSLPTINGTYQSVGIILSVTPFIGNNGLVEMILQPQNSSVDTSTPGQIIAYGSSLIGNSAVYAPNINITSANTVVITPNGQTVVIGGLISASKSSSDTKVPFLGDIPILGQLFRSSSKADAKTELLMFLTPHIVDAPSQLARLTNPEMSQAPLITNSISEMELNRFLERVPTKSEPAKKQK
jgi:general secretion pathway protein D